MSVDTRVPRLTLSKGYPKKCPDEQQRDNNNPHGGMNTHTHSSIYTDDQKKKNQTKKKGVKDGIPVSNTQSAHRLSPDTVFRGRVRPGSVVVASVADTRRSSEKGEMEEGDAARRSDAHALSRPEERWMGSLVARKVGTLSTNRSAATPTNKKVE